MASSGLCCLSCHIHNLHHGERDDNVAVCSSSCHVLRNFLKRKQSSCWNFDFQVSDYCILVQARPEHDVQD